MARLAINWIEKNFDLPYRINSIEKDLSDGYLFIQILHKCGKVTDDEMEDVKGPFSTDPGHALSNFKLVNRALKRWGLGLEKKEVADILLEQPGAAAAVVMNIKKKKEMKPPPPYPAYKDAIKSLRPKEYKRPAIGVAPEDPIEKFGRDAIKTLEFGTFNEIDMRCQLHEYEVFKNTRDNKIKDEEKIEKEEFQKYRKELYDTMVVREKNIVVKNKEDAKALKTRWVKSFDVKHHRQVRDLQFELATMKIKELKTRNTNRFYDSEQNDGINEFERNLKRSGIGGGDENAQLSTTYEDGMVFMNRIEDIAKTKWPTSAEVGDFISQLKQRTAEKAAARYDKARRRRRMLVEQNSKNKDTSSQIEFDNEDDEKEDSKLLETVMKMQQKEEQYQTKLKECQETMGKSRETAEEQIRIFAEQFRLLADEEADVRSQELAKILDARKVRTEERRLAATSFCREIVINLIADSLDGPNTRPQTAQTATTNGGMKTSKLPTAPTNMNLLLSQNPLQLSKNLFDFIRSRLDSNNYVSELTIEDIMTLDIWPAFATISMNIGNWLAEINIEEIESNDNVESKTVEGLEQNVDDGAVAAEVKDIKPPTYNRIVKLDRQLSFVESTQSILESLLHEYHVSLNPSPNIISNIDKALELTSSENNALSSKDSQTILILNGVHDAFITQNCFSKMIGMLGPNYQGALWDVVSSIEAANKMGPLLEGKTVTLNFPSILEFFATDYISRNSIDITCPEQLSNVALSPQVLRVANDMVEAASRVLSIKTSIVDGTFNFANCPFVDTTFAILLGQGLWMRNFIVKQFTNAAIPCPIPSLALVSSIISNKANIKHASSLNGETFVAVFNWFYRGGSRDNIPVDNTVLLGAIQEENAAATKGAAKGKGKPPAKGKGPEEELSVKSPLVSVICIDQLKKENVPYSKELSDEISTYDVIAEFASQKPAVLDDTRSALEALVKTNNINYFSVSLKDSSEANKITTSETTEISEPKEAESADADINANNNENLKSEQPITSSLIFCNELSFMEIALAIIVADGSASDIEEIKKSIELRRGLLSPSSKLWLLHSCQSNPLDMNSVFAANDSLYNFKSACMEYRGVLSMVFAVALFNIEKTIKRQEAEFISKLKSTDDRWKDTCKAFYDKCKTSSGKDTNILLGDLICRLGDIIDDRHVKWIERNTQLQHESMAEFYRLCKTLKEIKQQIGNSMFESLEVGKQSIMLVSSILENAGYSELPWQLKYYSPNSRIQLERYRDNLRAISALFDEKLGLASNSEEDDVWKSFASVEVPSSASPLGLVKASLLTDLYTENLEVSISWLSAIMAGMESLSKSLEQADVERQKYTHIRHSYEHRSLSQWALELRADASPTSYLDKFSFSVSSLESYDQIPAPSGISVIELNEKKLNLTLVKVLSEELNLKLDEIINENTTITNRKVALKIFSETVSGLTQKGHQLPQAFRDTKKFKEYFIRNLLRSANDTCTMADQKDFIKSMVLCLVFASLPSLPHLEYITRISNILGRVPTADIDDISILFNQENRLSQATFITKLMADSVVSGGWWPNADEQSINNIFSAVASCCLDSNKKVISEEFVLLLCRSPHLLDTTVFEKSLLLTRNMDVIIEESAPSAEILDILPSFLNEGIFKAMKVASMTKGLPNEDTSSSYSQGFQLNQQLYGTSKWIDKSQLDWIVSNTNTTLSLESKAKIFSHSIFGLREQQKIFKVVEVKDENVDKVEESVTNNNESSNIENVEENTDIVQSEPVQDNITDDNNNGTVIIIPYEIEGNTRTMIPDIFISKDICSMFSNERNLLKKKPLMNSSN